MLSRTADHLFWMSRYTERAENTARMLSVSYETSLLPQAAEAAREGWEGLLSISELIPAYQQQAPLEQETSSTAGPGGENAAPVLKAHGYPATVYAVSSLVGKTSAWVAPEGLEPAPLMNVSQLREVQDLGFTIGSHTVTHPRLADADDARIHAEMRDSKRALEDILGQRVEHFCYPYGSHDLRAVEAAAAAGYVTGTTCVRAAATPADDLLTLPRKAVSRGDDVFGVAWKLLTKNLPKHAQIRRT